MKYNLSNFYRSDEWRDFREIVINDRLNENGDIIDEYTGEVIVRKYDIILHHVIPLTEQNVNDLRISLNPNNIMIISHKSHNRIHKKFRTDEEVRQVFLVYGSPLSGKTTWVDGVKNAGDLIVDLDSIWQCISGLERYEKPGVLNACAFGVRDYLMECVRYRRGKWLNAYVIGGYPLSGERERLCRELGAREVFINTSKEECLARLEKAEDHRNHDEWQKYIEEWWRRYAPGL